VRSIATLVNGEVRVVDDVAQAFASLVASEAPPSIALSGGHTARECYERLRGARVDWPAVDVFFGDERFVPVDNPDSNEGMARRALLDHVDARSIHSMRGREDTLEAAAAAYDTLVRDHGPVALVHLGLGPDGHTASLFPGSPALREEQRLVVGNPGDATHPHDRLTFTYRAIAESGLVVFTVAGADKRDALSRIRAGDDLPATHVTADRVIWLVDPPAGS
jgi:6-phosphogluconolactonase